MQLPPLMAVDEALARVIRAFAPVDSETVDLFAALGRTLSEPVLAAITNPPFDASAMDGYAVRAADLDRSSSKLKLIGESGAGHPFTTMVKPGECVRIFTGGALPPGADSILIQENADREETPDGIFITSGQSVPKGRFVRAAGRDFAGGAQILPAGQVIGPAEIALAGAANVARVDVRRKPRIAILSNGDELVPPGTDCKPGQIPASNALALGALINAHGGVATDLGIARDTTESLQRLAARAEGHDLLVTIGGASIGDHDLVQAALGPMGLDVDFWRIAMRPGKPLISGTLGHMPFLGLPGNPVSAQVCGFLFVLPALRRMLGQNPVIQPPVQARLQHPVGANGARQAYLRGMATFSADGTLYADVFDEQDSAYLRPLAEANALIVRPPMAEPAAPGDLVPLQILKMPS